MAQEHISLPIIKKFSQTGILSHAEENLQHLPNKDAILVLSFGTAQQEAR